MFCLLMKKIKFILALLAFLSSLTAFSQVKKIINAHREAEYGKPIEFYKVPKSSAAMSLVLENGKLYALEKDGLSIYNIDNPKMPKKVGFVGGMGNVRQLRICGKTAFLSSRQCGLWAVDVSDDKNPKIISNFDTIEMATGLDVVGNLAVIGNRVYGVQCIDVSNPAQMKHLSSIRTDESQSVLYRNGLIFSGDWAGGEITVIDAKDIKNLKPISKIKLDGYGDGFVIRGNILYASTGQHKKSGPVEKRHGAGRGLDIFDISDPANPKKLSKTHFPDIYFGPCDYWTPRVSGDYCFASDTLNGVFMVDIKNPAQPKILGNLILPKRDPENRKIHPPFRKIWGTNIPQGDPVSSIAIGDGVLYIAGTYTGIYIAEIDGLKPEARDVGEIPNLPQSPFDASEKGFISSGAELTNPIRAVALDGDIAYAANIWGGLKVFKLSDGKMELKRIEKIPYVADVKRAGRKLYMAEGLNGLGIYEIVSDNEIKEIGRLTSINETVNFVQYVWAFEGVNIVALTNAQARIMFVDVSNPKEPKIIFQQMTSQLMYGNYGSQQLVKNRYWALNRHCGGHMIFDLANNSAKLSHRDDFPMCSQTGSVTKFGDKFLAMRAGHYALIDPENPTPTKELKRHLFPSQKSYFNDVEDGSMISRAMFPKSDFEGLVYYDETSKKLAVLNRMFYICRTYDFSDANNPKLLNKYDMKSPANVPTFWKGKLLLPGGYAGLLMEK